MKTVVLLFAILLIVLGILLGPSALAYVNNQGPLPGGVTLAGMTPTGANLEEVARNLHAAFQEPVAVSYDDQLIILRPTDVDFQVDVNSMVAEAVPYGKGLGYWRPFLGEVFDRPITPVDIPVQYSYSQEKLAEWLQGVADDYDVDARPPYGVALAPGVPFTSTFMFQAGQPGLELEFNMSGERVLKALSSATDRRADLMLVEVPPPAPDIKELEKLVENRADRFPGWVSVFIKQVGGDTEAISDPEIAFAGMSTMKIPIMLELYRSVLDEPPDIETTKLLTETLGLSGNFTANLLLRLIGGGAIGNEWQGADQVTATLRNLGLKNTFMATPYDTESLPRTYSTPANSRTDVTTKPDEHMQTTAKDLALILEWIVECSEGRGTLLAAYPDQITPAECQEMLGWVELNRKHILLETGVPEGTRYAHKHGFVDDSHGDVGVFWGPAGPYIVSVFIYKPGWIEWDLSSSLMADISKASWDYFTLVANGGEPPSVETPVESAPEETSVPTPVPGDSGG
ncbi:MAG: serine hydrolase [Anaerolineae bacterium]|nr:serine hydrolase [Anaerolineae bacterium]MCB0205676.1 serine hydrolase [Anaerolineae bacterium]MCB0253821.1 serine hydrolase [Anaerolineae bacterium]